MKNYKLNTHEKFMKLAFKKAYINLGSTKDNPSVGCVVVQGGSVISSGYTSYNGRPHAEFNALNCNKNFKNSDLYVTLEPCIHFGKTPPCVKKIIKKKIKKVFYSIPDYDDRTRNKAKSILNKNKISVKSGILKEEAKKFYKSYFLMKKGKLPLLDAKIAISKDFFSVNKNKKWITNSHSRNRVHHIRSKYDCILSTYKSVNADNSQLNCRINGLEKLSPSRVIIDKDLKLKKNLKLFNLSKKIKTYVITFSKNKVKEKYLKSKNVKVIKFKKNKNIIPYEEILMILKRKGFSRILCESGLYTTREIIKKNLVNNLYVFQSSSPIKKKGKNSYKTILNNLKNKKKDIIKVNLFGDKFYNFRIK